MEYIKPQPSNEGLIAFSATPEEWAEFKAAVLQEDMDDANLLYANTLTIEDCLCSLKLYSRE